MDSFQTLREAHAVALRLSNVAGEPNSAREAVNVARAWPYLAVAAATAGAAFATPDPAHTLDRVALSARAAHLPVEHEHHWPGRGPIDANRARLLEHLHQLARQDTSFLSVDQRQEATRLLTSIVWVTAEHSTRVLDRYADGHEIDPVRRLGDRLAAGRHLAASALHASEPSSTARTTAAALARWDVEAHRAMLNTRSTLTLHAVATLQADITSRLDTAIQHAAGHVDDVEDRDLKPIRRALDEAASAWRSVADAASDYGVQWEPLSPNLITAGHDLRQQLLAEVKSPPPADQQRDVLAVHHSHLASMVSITTTAHDLSRGDGLRAPSVVIERILRERDSTRPVLTMPRTLPLPRELRAEITGALHDAEAVSAGALRESFGLDKVYRSTTGAARTLPVSRLDSVPALPPLIVEDGPVR